MRCRNILIILLLLQLFTVIAHAQQLDSLLQVLANHKKEDTIKLNLLISISREYQLVSPLKGIETADLAIALAKTLNNKLKLAEAYRMKGENNSRDNRYAEASDLYQQAFNLYEQLGYKKGIGACFLDMGNDTKDNTKKLELYEKSINLNEQIGYKLGVAGALSNIGGIYLNLSNYSRALDFYKKAIGIYEQLGEKRRVAVTFGNMGNVYRSL